MANSSKLFGAAAGLTALVSLGACGAQEEQHNYTGQCSVVTNSAGNRTIRVQDEFGTLMLHGSVTAVSGASLIAENPSERSTGLNYVENPLATPEWIRLGNNKTVITMNAPNTEFMSCTVKFSIASDQEIVHNVSMTGEFKRHPFFDSSMPGEATIRALNGEPQPKTTFAPAGENAIDVPKSQRTPADPAP